MKSIKTYTSAQQALQEIFGYDDFREPQAEIIENVVTGNDGLVVLATGNGKSLCYQIPALMSEGLTIVVTPLISLMKDQVDTLVRKGVPAVSLYGEQSFEEKQKSVKALDDNKAKLLYVSPEKLLDEDFQQYLAQKNISRFAVDEAHCVSIWGRNFRASYTHLGNIIDNIGNIQGKRIQRFALTATANEVTRDDIRKLLHMEDNSYELVGSFDRPNLSFDVRPTKNKMESVMDYILQNPNEPTIVYSATVKLAVRMVDYLNLQGIPTGLYHGRMDAEVKNGVQDAFMRDELNVIVATNAFGMGVDKPNVRHVLHLNMPGNIENFYQEAGRGGRDGKNSSSVIFYSDKDMNLQDFFKNANYPEESAVRKVHDVMRAFDPDEPFNIDAQVIADYSSLQSKEAIKIDAALRIMADQGMIVLKNEIGSNVYNIEINGDKINNKLDLSFIQERRVETTARINQMVRYCVTNSCRTQYLLAALGEPRNHKNCGRCDNCERELKLKNTNDQKLAEEVVSIALNLMNTMSKTSLNQDSIISKVLLGTNSMPIRNGRAGDKRLIDLQEFGALKNWKTNEVDALIKVCEENEFIEVKRSPTGKGKISMTSEGLAWLSGENKPIVKATSALKDRAIGPGPDEKTAQKVNLTGVNGAIRDELKKWRKEKSKENGHQEMMILSDEQIDKLTTFSGSATHENLIESGISKARAKKIGNELLSIVNKEKKQVFEHDNDYGL